MQRDTFKKLIAFPPGTEEKVTNYAQENNLNFTEAVLDIIEQYTAEESIDTFTWVSDYGHPDFIATPAQHELLTICKAHSAIGGITSCSAIMKDLGSRTTAAKVYERLEELRGPIALIHLRPGKIMITMMATLEEQ